MRTKTVFNVLAVLFLALTLGNIQATRSTQAQELGPLSGNVIQGTVLGTAFTYQGRLTNTSGDPVSGPCILRFSLYQSAAGNDPVGTPLTANGVTPDNGYFSVALDFGADAFRGEGRFLKVEVDCGSGSFTALDPRVELTPAPYALYAASSGALRGNPVSDNAPAAGDMLAWDGNSWLPTAPAGGAQYANVIVVAKSGGQFTSIQAALNSITDADWTNRYLIWVAPGVYTERVTMKPHIDIEGAGELATKLTYTGDTTYATGTVMGAHYAELRHLTVENTGGANYATAMYNDDAAPFLSHVTLLASGGGSVNRGMLNVNGSQPQLKTVSVSVLGSGAAGSDGIFNEDSLLQARDTMLYISGGTVCNGVHNSQSVMKLIGSTIYVGDGSSAGYGVKNVNSDVDIWNSSITASGGVTATEIVGVDSYTSGSLFTAHINQSRISAFSGHTISNYSNAATYVGASWLSGGAVIDSGGVLTCAGVYDEDYVFYASTCP